jgi:uncharacterized protein YggU (UPF0235/DUF167 family)
VLLCRVTQIVAPYMLAELQDLLELMRTILACRLGQLSLVRGDSTRHKKLLVSNMTPEQVFDKLRATLQK